MQVDESWAEQVESQIRASVPVSCNQAADIAEASWPSCCFSVQFLELASYGVNDVDAARGSRCGFHGALFYTKAFLHAHGINWTAETKRKQEDDAAAADNDPMPLLAWKLKTSAPRPRRLLQRARHQHAVTTKARAPGINIIICIQHYI